MKKKRWRLGLGKESLVRVRARARDRASGSERKIWGGEMTAEVGKEG